MSEEKNAESAEVNNGLGDVPQNENVSGGDHGLPVQKWLQAHGFGSRKSVRTLLTEGRVQVDGEVVRRFAFPVIDGAEVRVDGDRVDASVERVVYLMNKPKKHITGLVDPEDRPTLAPYIPQDAPRIFPVGRLDFNTEGALLWTNDGTLARKLLHPDYGIEKVYHVKVRGHLDEEDPGFERIRSGLRFKGVEYQPAQTRIVTMRTRATWVEIILREGKFHEVRRMCAANRWQIVKLRRMKVGPIELGELNPRCIRRLSEAELEALDACVEQASVRAESE